MNGSQLDDFLRSLKESRRSLLGGALAAVAGLLARRGAGVEAKRKRKRGRRKQRAAPPNEYGCIGVGDPCKDTDQCCSGVCDGKKGKKRCRAHHTGTCRQGGEGHCIAPDPARNSCNGTSDCACARTTAGSDVCVADAPSGIDYCTDCVTDADCEAVGYPAGSVCLPLHEGICAGVCDSNRACFPPCGAQWPQM